MATRKAVEPERSRQAAPSFAVLAAARVSDAVASLCDELEQSCSVYFLDHQHQTLIEQLARHSPDIILVELDDSPDIRELANWIKEESLIPLIALVRRETIGVVDSGLAFDDFLISPYDIKELRLRVKRLLGKTYDKEDAVIRYGDLVIDLDKCEVTLCGRVIMLTFREYELLKYLAGNPERVFTRETLLNKVWGYDYYGGDRTVDVHIRRLRSKIEDMNHAFVETVRNIGYRFSPGS